MRFPSGCLESSNDATVKRVRMSNLASDETAIAGAGCDVMRSAQASVPGDTVREGDILDCSGKCAGSTGKLRTLGHCPKE